MAARAVQVVTEVAALNRPFDYLVTDATAQVALGDRVRVSLHHRSVRGWVVGEAPIERELKPLLKWLGYGPPANVVELARWAAWRWYAPWSRFLGTASPTRVVTTLPTAPVKGPIAPSRRVAPEVASGVVTLAPTVDPMDVILSAYQQCERRDGSLLVLVPHEAWALRLRERLARRGLAVCDGDDWARVRAQWPVIVATRAGAMAPTPLVAGVVVLDADDESYRSTSAPTWHAVDLVRERCARDDAPYWLTSFFPSPALSVATSTACVGDAGDWPRVEVVDRRQGDPHDGALTREAVLAAHRALASDEAVAVVVILQRLGAGRLLACAHCGELARCAQCAQAEQDVEGQLACRDRHELRARFCRDCGATKFRSVRSGVTTLARDVSLQLGQPVSEITASSTAEPLARVVVGTEAVLTRVRRAGVVIFADLDQYLLAPRAEARRQAVSAIARAGRLVGARRAPRGSLVLQTRRANDLVVACAVAGEFEPLRREEIDDARLLGLAPFGARADVSGEGARDFVAALPADVVVRELASGFTLRASSANRLAEVLAATPRPAATLRVGVE
ncbi:MAG: hypothetical protein KGJ10_05920 [Acidobacteriota bacterium]|nr:hypothetical protein [Acidobacteriota bacterium]